MQTYNNKALPLTDVSTLYTEIFLSPKITNSPLMLYIGTNSLSLSSLLQTKTEEVTI